MHKRNALILALTTLLLGGQVSSPLYRSSLYPQLEALQQRGMTYRLLDNDLVEVKQEWSGMSRTFSLREPSEADIRAWAQARGIPILEIDPNTIDTSAFTGWYRYWTQVPLSNGQQLPLVFGDVNRNGKLEAYGTYRDFGSQEWETRTYEIDSTGLPTFAHNYGQPRPGPSRWLTDVNNDSLQELLCVADGWNSFYKQASPTELPITLDFVHRQFYGPNGAGLTGIFLGSLDGDSRTDFLYVGTEIDSTDTTRSIGKEFVAEFDPNQNNFQRVWGQHLHWALGGFAVGDFDLDGKTDIVSSSVFGNVYVVENTGNNQYQLVWQDSVPFVNVYYQTAGDVDGDGKPEFFVGAVTDGYYLTMYEADSVHHYSPKLMIHFLAGDWFPDNFCDDVDDDGRLELVTMIGTDLLVLKSNTDNNYYVWYLKREDRKQCLGLFDFNRDEKTDFVVSKAQQNQQGQVRLFTDIYLAQIPTGVREQNLFPKSPFELRQNYPNPFNPTTMISFSLPAVQHVCIEVFDIGGRKAATVFQGLRSNGENSIVWNASDNSGKRLSSGVYLLRMNTETGSQTIKLLLLR